MEDRETDLIRKCQAGDKGAFGDLVKQYAGVAVGSATLLLGNRDDALDASQEAFVKAWRAIRRFDGRTSFYAWYGTILRNCCVDRLRKRARTKTVGLPDDGGVRETGPGPVLLAERNELRDRLWRAIMELSGDHREIIVMSHFQEMSYKEIAAALDIPVGTVMSRLYYARRALRNMLADEEP